MADEYFDPELDYDSPNIPHRQSRINGDEIVESIEEIEQLTIPNIDARVIGGIYKASYYACMKKHELIKARVGDVIKPDGVPTHMEIRGARDRSIPLDQEAQEFFRGYLDHLGNGRYGTAEDAPLFPGMNNEEYNERTLSKHINRFKDETKELRFRFDLVRQAGIKRLIIKKRNEGMTIEDAISSVSGYTGLSRREVNDIWNNKIQPAGIKRQEFWDKNEPEINLDEEFVFSGDKGPDTMAIILRIFAIKEDPTIDSATKENMINRLKTEFSERYHIEFPS